MPPGHVPSKPSPRPDHHSFLRPEDAFHAASPPRPRSPLGRPDVAPAAPSTRDAANAKRRNRSGSRRRRAGASAPTAGGAAPAKGQWKKLLWVKQAFPDNYTDEETFLDHLQRNPRLRPYEFWPLVADCTVIVQHVATVVIFGCCFVAIFQERARPQTVVAWATAGTVAGWVMRDYWLRVEEAAAAAAQAARSDADADAASRSSLSDSSPVDRAARLRGSPVSAATSRAPSVHSRDPSAASFGGAGSTPGSSPPSFIPAAPPPASVLSPRTQARLATAKSALLISSSLLGLSPILKSLTVSTASDSIWVLSSWLMVLNVITFDYGAGPAATFPAPLSTNAALMASTVLASRLPSTAHVFSLTLFSIEVFGLFPVFRRHLRHRSWSGHLGLTAFLVLLAGAALGIVVAGAGCGGGGGVVVVGLSGACLAALITCLGMGATSWWLIGLQRYKNEIRGPWDPARPVIRRHWN